MFPKLILYRKGFIYLESRFFNNKLGIYLLFQMLGDLYTISIYIISPAKKYLYYQHNGLVMVTAACVDVFMAPRLSFRVSAKLRDGATVANLSPAFKPIIFHAGHGGQPCREHRLLQLRDGRCLALPQKHHDGHDRIEYDTY